MERRAFLGAVTSGLLAAPLAAEAQQTTKVYRLGLLFTVLPSTFPHEWPFYERMRELGWVYGRDFVAEHRVYGDRYDVVPELAIDLLRAGVDVFIVNGGIEASRTQQVTRTIPIVTTRAGDLVVMGLAASLARPGGNVTGIQTPELITKHLSLLKDTVPRLSRVGILYRGSRDTALREAEAGGKALGIALQSVKVEAPGELDSAFSSFHAKRVQGVIILRDAVMGAAAKTLADLSLHHRLATISDIPFLAAQGGLMSYGYDVPTVERSAADIVDKILRGAKAARFLSSKRARSGSS